MGEVTVKRHERVIAGAHGGRFDYRTGLGDAAGTTFEALGWAFRGIVHRRRLKKLLREAGDPVRLAVAPEGIGRVEGRVEILEGVSESGAPCAAFVRRSTTDRPCGCQPACNVEIRSVETRHGAGRFAIRDESGVAIVSGPWIRLLDYHGRQLDPMEAGALLVREGDAVTVIGRAHHEHADDPRLRRSDGYRGVRPVPVYYGTQDAPVHVFCSPPE